MSSPEGGSGKGLVRPKQHIISDEEIAAWVKTRAVSKEVFAQEMGKYLRRKSWQGKGKRPLRFEPEVVKTFYPAVRGECHALYSKVLATQQTRKSVQKQAAKQTGLTWAQIAGGAAAESTRILSVSEKDKQIASLKELLVETTKRRKPTTDKIQVEEMRKLKLANEELQATVSSLRNTVEKLSSVLKTYMNKNGDTETSVKDQVINSLSATKFSKDAAKWFAGQTGAATPKIRSAAQKKALNQKKRLRRKAKKLAAKTD